MNSIVLLAILFAMLPAAKSESFYAIHSCSDTTTYAPNSTYGSHLRALLATLSNSSTSHFNTASTQPPQKIQALYQCRNDISLEECASCVSNATSVVLQKCPIEKTAVIWYDNCLLRFSNESIVSVLSTLPTWYLANAKNVSEADRALFTGFVREDLNSCATEAANSQSKFAVKERNTNFILSSTARIYSLVQCTDDLSNGDCSRCLQDALGQYPSCCDAAIGARVLMPSCNFRYEIYSFYNPSGIAPAPAPPPSPSPAPTPSLSPSYNTTENPSNGKSGLSKGAIISIAIPVGLLGVSFCIGCFVFVRRRRIPHRVQETTVNAIIEESLVFSLSTIKEATNNFSSQNFLGSGGYGDVFKGALKDGNEVAVKRLVENSCQGETEFKNEVNVVSNLQHRNLTKLLGFCLEGDERILVYEYVPNKSLDLFLFGRHRPLFRRAHDLRKMMSVAEKEGGSALEWAQRYKIIEGTARGMLYLHEDSRLKIIHRDLKASNVLLDGYLNPKISDFGMARICGIDETKAFTKRIVGTYGYMAPEYALHGKFSVKSDVYSFGVLVLEIITGLKATEFCANDNDGYDDLVGFVWRHWMDKTVMKAVDKRIKKSYSKQEVLRCVHVALLCVEESPVDRPTMATMVLILNRESASVSLPKQPFINVRSIFSELRSRLEVAKPNSNSWLGP